MDIKLLLIMFTIISVISAENLQNMIRNKLQRLIEAKKIKRDYEPYTEPELKDEEKYDFIIVGSGSGGSALINRLSEEEQWNILVLEAGGEPDILTDIPIWSALANLPDQNWGFLIEKEDNFALGLKNQMRLPRGKVLGGTSQLNNMIASRGVKHDYDRWESLGNPGWSYKDLLPLFKKLENCKINHQHVEYRGHHGEMDVEDTDSRSKGVHAFLEASKQSGYKYVDYNGEDHVGYSYVQASTRNGLRCSGERCFIRKAKNRSNLTIRLNSHVTKVLIDNEKNAYGVEFVKNGMKYVALADKEVILCAGVINSAHLLLLSGIGPKEDLGKFGITTIEDLPVGKKMYDQPGYFGLSFKSDQKIALDASELMNDQSYIDLFNNGTGPLNNIGGIEAVVFSTTPLAQSKNLSDVEITYWATNRQDFGLVRSMGLFQNNSEGNYRPENENAITAIIILLKPRSYGYLQLHSSNPFIHPKIYGKYLTDPEGRDMKNLIAGIREAIRIYTAEPMKKYGIRLVDTPMPPCEKYKFDSDEYWECTLRHFGRTTYHHTTTCKMGPKHDPEAVVDHELKVYGIGNLRVADTSIIPEPITGHTNIPAYMIGEKAAEMIKEKYLKV